MGTNSSKLLFSCYFYFISNTIFDLWLTATLIHLGIIIHANSSILFWHEEVEIKCVICADEATRLQETFKSVEPHYPDSTVRSDVVSINTFPGESLIYITYTLWVSEGVWSPVFQQKQKGEEHQKWASRHVLMWGIEPGGPSTYKANACIPI